MKTLYRENAIKSCPEMAANLIRNAMLTGNSLLFSAVTAGIQKIRF